MAEDTAKITPATTMTSIPNAASTSTKPTVVTSAAPAAIKPVTPVTLATAVNKANATALKVPVSLTRFNTKSLGSGYFHGCIYSETSARKTSTAATFGSPKDVRIIVTRRQEQLIPLMDMGYEAAAVTDDDALLFALRYPEQLWPDWAENPNRILVLDDATEAVAMLLDGASVIDGKEVKDRRRSYTEAGENLREAIKVTLEKPQHFVMVALAKVRENSLTNEERIAPDLPPSMMNMILTEMEYVFYIKPGQWVFYTDRDFVTVTDTDAATGKEKTFRREIFAKNKLPLNLAGKGIINKTEPLDLAKIWEKVKRAK